MKGVEKTELDFQKRTFTLRVKEGVTLSRETIVNALPEKFSLTEMRLQARGEIFHDEIEGLQFQPRRQKQRFSLVAAKKSPKVLAGIQKSALAQHYSVSGVVEEIKKSPSDTSPKGEKKTPSYRLVVTEVKAIEIDK